MYRKSFKFNIHYVYSPSNGRETAKADMKKKQ